jgi:hypothetical protein
MEDVDVLSMVASKPDAWLEDLERRACNGIRKAEKVNDPKSARALEKMRDLVRSILEARRSVGAN